MKKNWQIKKLGEVCVKVTKGGTPTTYGYSFTESGVNFIKIENINNGKVNLKSIRNFISEEAHTYQKKSILEVNDLLFSIAGTIGEICLIKKEYLPANTNQALAILRGYDEFLTPQFLTFQLNSSISQYVKSKARGGAMNNISLEDLKNLDLVLPPLETQQAIVSKIEELFSELDKGIEDLKTAQQQLKTYRQSVLKWAFEGKLTNVNVKECELPVGWERNTLGNICDLKAGNFVKASEIEEVYNEKLYKCFGGNGLRGYVKTYTHEGLHALVGRQGALCGNVHLAEGKFHATEHAVVVSTTNNVDMKCLYYKLKEMRLNQYSSGVAQPGLSVNKLLPIEIYFPSNVEEQHCIVQEIESRLSVADKMEESIAQSLQQAEALRQSILKKAFSGELV